MLGYFFVPLAYIGSHPCGRMFGILFYFGIDIYMWCHALSLGMPEPSERVFGHLVSLCRLILGSRVPVLLSKRSRGKFEV